MADFLTICEQTVKLTRSRRSESRDYLKLVLDFSVFGGAADAIHAVQSCQNEFDTRCADGWMFRRVNLEGLLPHRWNVLKSFGVGFAGEAYHRLQRERLWRRSRRFHSSQTLRHIAGKYS